MTIAKGCLILMTSSKVEVCYTYVPNVYASPQLLPITEWLLYKMQKDMNAEGGTEAFHWLSGLVGVTMAWL